MGLLDERCKVIGGKRTKDHGHKFMVGPVICITFFLLFSATVCYAGTKEVLMALEAMKGSLESGANLLTWTKLTADTTVAINIAKRDKTISKDFITAAETAKQNYDVAFRAAKIRQEFGEDKNLTDAINQ
jgi:hypothetical protein